MAEILHDPSVETSVHVCDEEMPGYLKAHYSDGYYYPKMTPGTIIQCSCGEVYIGKHTGYKNLGCELRRLGYWEARRYRKKKVNY